MTSRPGRIKEIVDIDLPEAHQVEDRRGTEAFVHQRHQIWELLHDEVRRSFEDQELSAAS